MDETKKVTVRKDNKCQCGSCHHQFFLLRLVLGLAIIGFVFWGGIKIGEIKAFMEGQSGRHWGSGYRDDSFGPGMMDYQDYQYNNSSTYYPVMMWPSSGSSSKKATTTPR